MSLIRCVLHGHFCFISASILNSLNQTLHYEHYLIYRAIRQSLHNSKQHHNQQSSPTSIDEASTKTTRNNTQLVSDNNYHTHKQIKGYWYIYCIILVSGFLALFLLVFIPQKVFRKYKRKVQNRKNTNVSEYQMVSNSCQPPGRHLLLQTSHENTLNNQYYPHDSLVYRSPDLVYNPKKYAVNEFNQRHKPVDVNNSDFEVYTKHEEVNPYDEQTLLQPYDLHVTSPKEYQIKPNDESFEQVYLIISSHNNTYSNNNINNNTRCCSLSPLNRQQTTVSNQDSYVHNVWNKRKNTDEIKESDGESSFFKLKIIQHSRLGNLND
ncbi:unnamed protein product [Trichobilharzia regenti]|nr:unnamed protein product [Trichobilharzia regenti]